MALVAILSDAGLRRSEAAALTWGDVQRWDDGSGRITVVRSKTDAEAQGVVVAVTPAAMAALSAIRPASVASNVKVFGLSESQIARRVKAIAKGRRVDRLGVLQRARRHGPAHGPERRAHPRDRTPGPLEAGRRHGRPLHPRRIRRFGAAVPVAMSRWVLTVYLRSGIDCAIHKLLSTLVVPIGSQLSLEPTQLAPWRMGRITGIVEHNLPAIERPG